MKNKKRTQRKQKTSSLFATRRGKLFLLAAAVIILLVFFLRGPRGAIGLYKNTQQRNQLLKDIDQLKQTKVELDSEKVLLNDDDYIEKTAREQYNMKIQGEKIYKIKKDSN